MKKIAMLFMVGIIFLVAEFVQAEEVTIVGTGSGVSVLKSVGEAFKQKSGVTVNIPPSIGSGGGIKSVGADQYKIGRIARELNEKEKVFGLTCIPVAKLPVVFFVNKGVGINVIDFSGKACSTSEIFWA